MKSTLLATILLTTGALGALLAFSPAAQAQDVSEFSRQAPANSAQSGMRPGIRYTTGAVTTVGWEKTLTEGDSNLKNWHWSAMTSYTQSQCYNKIAPGAYVKKINNNPDTPALKPAGSIYVKPIQVSPELYAKKRVQPGVIVVGNNNASGNVSGRVRIPRTNQIAAVPPPAAKSYNVNYLSGSLVPGSDNGFANRNVTGRLMRTLQ